MAASGRVLPKVSKLQISGAVTHPLDYTVGVWHSS